MPIRIAAVRRTALGLALSLSLGVSLAQPVASSATSTAAAPGDDFFTYANSEWLDKTEIPADQAEWGSFSALDADVTQRLRKLIEAIDAGKARGESRQIADYYAAFMDEAGIEARGLAPLQPELDKIAAIADKRQLARALGATLRADVDALNSTQFHTGNLFGLWVAQGLDDTRHYVPYLLQGGLGLPDRAYYLDDNPHMAALREQYQAYIAAQLARAGFDDAAGRAARVMAFETRLAQSHVSREDSEEVQKANNHWTLNDFAAKAPGLDWAEFFKAAGLGDQRRFMVWQPSGISGGAALVASEDLATWKDYLSFHLINHFARVLPKAFADAQFAFQGTALAGTPQQPDRWKRGINETSAALSDPLGHLYVDHYFPAEYKQRITAMVANVIAAFNQRIDRLDWMAPATRAEAKAKLKTLYVGVGYPEHWRAWTGLKVEPHDALGNLLRSERFHLAQQLAKLHQPVDRREWAMAAQEVNAVNMPLQNALNFPAAILQSPYFDPKASDARNYGAIGATIGHEISHSFDNEGAQFDAQGRMRDWWTPADGAHFKTATAALAAQYSAYRPFPDLAVNGQQTLSENLADLAGLNASYDAYRAAAKFAPDQIGADREFFLGFAESWREKVRESAARQQVITNGHAPARYRAYTVRNLDAWYRAFDVQPGQALYLAPEQRVRVW
ncbi:MAG: M13 family metallopeptidase [Paucibacter sp.]|nr:M13 family metallopeptidase [Roseateles sp.]